MKKFLFILFATFYAVLLHAQYKVTFILKEQSAIKYDCIYVTGTFSNWDATANKNYLLHPYGGNEKAITLNLKAGVIKYKFHRGSWATVEKKANGDEVPDRIVTIHKDTTLTDSIARWRDQWLNDSLYALAKEKEDSNRVKILASIAIAYAGYDFYNADSAFVLCAKSASVTAKNNDFR
jgi:hypothetical protein